MYRKPKRIGTQNAWAIRSSVLRQRGESSGACAVGITSKCGGGVRRNERVIRTAPTQCNGQARSEQGERRSQPEDCLSSRLGMNKHGLWCADHLP